MHKEFYQRVENMNPNHINRAMTVLEGTAFGEKALFTDGELIWMSKADGFFAAHREEAEKNEDSTVMQIGSCRVFCETLAQEKKLVVCGGGHVSVPVIRIGRMIGCHVTVLEDRPKFADDARRAGASEVICAPFEEGLAKIAGDADTYFIILTRGHRFDQACLEQIARKPHAYIGMIGSRRRTILVKKTAVEHGADREVIDRVYTPVGLDIGAETPEEIAVAIMAEIIAVKNKQKQSGGYPKDILRAILQAEEGAENLKVLATIVSRKGSAPRSEGTKMLILPDGGCIGTIGGGCAESQIIQKALFKIRSGSRMPELFQADMTGAKAEEEGMVCGGVIEVLLEAVWES